MRVLVITNLFPNSQSPRAASFNRQQFAALGKSCEVEVLATLPWYPGQHLLSKYATHGVATQVPYTEEIDGLRVYHPRTLHLPKLGTPIAAPLFAASLLPLVLKYRSKIDVVLGSWAHPDGCAAIALAKLLGVPSVVKVHGTDINMVSKLPIPRRVLQAMLPKADAIIAVSTALGNEVEALGVRRERIHQVMNGVAADKFYLRERKEARLELGLPQNDKIALYVGNLIESKGVVDLKKAFASIKEQVPNLHLYLAGEGKARPQLEAQTPKRMTLLGSLPFAKIPLWMAACDFLVLPSWNEGTPNVVLEALSCGRRVIATEVGGVPDLIGDDRLGRMIPTQNPGALANALLQETKHDYDPVQVAKLGARGDWSKSAADLEAVLQSVVGR